MSAAPLVINRHSRRAPNCCRAAPNVRRAHAIMAARPSFVATKAG
jgi:hypothetical protein